jgi:glycosyltransferase involved in cell wall biosynthesis
MNVLILTYWSFKEPLTQAAVMPYLKMIQKAQNSEGKIWLLSLEKPHLRLTSNEKAIWQEAIDQLGIELILRPYHPFGFRALISWASTLWQLVKICKYEKIKVVHAFGSPAGSAAQVLHRFLKIPYVIDSYEPHAESMVENGSWKKNGLAFRILDHFENKIARQATAVVATTASMKEYAAATYGAIPGNFLVKPACVDLNKFNPANHSQDLKTEFGLTDKVVCIYAGKIGGIYLTQEIFDFFKCCTEVWGTNFHVILLSDCKEEEVKNYAQNSGLSLDTITLRYVPHEEVPGYMSIADFALNPVAPVPSKRHCTSIKDGEYWAMGLPVVIPNHISDDSELIMQEQIGAVLDTLDDQAYRRAALKIQELLKGDPDKLAAKIRNVAQNYRSYDLAQSVYSALYAPGGIMTLKPKHFLALIYNSFNDPLYANLMHRYLQRQLALNRNYQLDLITFEQKRYALTAAEANHRKVQLTGERIFWHPLTYHSGRFMLVKKAIDFVSASTKVLRISIRRKPTMFLAFANTSAALSILLSKLTNSKLLIYSYEPHSDFLADFGIWKRSGWRYRVLNYLENKAGREAEYVLTGTKHMVSKLEGKVKGKVFRAPSGVDEHLFAFSAPDRRQLRNIWKAEADTLVLLYVGKFGGIYYREEIARFCKGILDQNSNVFCVFVTPSPQVEVELLLDMAGIPKDKRIITEGKSPEEINKFISASDIGLSAIPPLENQKYRSPVKVGEYLLGGLPYITCRGVSEDDEVAESHKVGLVVEALNSLEAHRIYPSLIELLSEDKEVLRSRCRTTGINYRSRRQVDLLLDEILAES